MPGRSELAGGAALMKNRRRGADGARVHLSTGGSPAWALLVFQKKAPAHKPTQGQLSPVSPTVPKVVTGQIVCTAGNLTDCPHCPQFSRPSPFSLPLERPKRLKEKSRKDWGQWGLFLSLSLRSLSMTGMVPMWRLSPKVVTVGDSWGHFLTTASRRLGPCAGLGPTGPCRSGPPPPLAAR
jgi:hypothetical protein